MALMSTAFVIGCTCIYYTPEVLYKKLLCQWNPAFVARIAEIHNNRHIEGYNRILPVELIEVWKGLTNIKKISTPSTSGNCELNTTISQRLLISSKI